MRKGLVIAAMTVVLVLTGCSSGDGGEQRESGADETSDPITEDQVNRYQLAFNGEVTLDNTGGLLCRVDDGVLSFDFGIDAYDGPISYTITVPGFDPADSALEGTFAFTDSPGQSEGLVELTFSIGDPPEGYEGVVRTAGAITGSMSGDGGSADINGTYACFLMDAEVGR